MKTREFRELCNAKTTQIPDKIPWMRVKETDAVGMRGGDEN